MKKILAVLLALTMTTGVLAGCSANTNEVEDKSESPRSSQAEQSEPDPEPELTNAEKAVAVLESLASGDPQPITDYVSADGYIQHNLTFADGRQTMLDALAPLKEAGSTVDVKRVFTDGDYVFLHTQYKLFEDRLAGIDVFRFEDGLIVEHWDNLDAIVERTPSGHTQFDGETTITDLDKTEDNKKLVESFVYDVLHGENPDNLTEYFDDDNYIQHNVAIADGLSGLGEALAEMAENGIEMVYTETYMVLGEGNFVLAVSEGTFGGAATSFFDIFRVEDGKIAEHWDVMETILPECEHAHDNGKF